MKKHTAKAPLATVLTVLALIACQPLAAYTGRITMMQFRQTGAI